MQDAGIDAILLAGTTGEGISLSLEERKIALLRCVNGPLPVLAHCGAQTTGDTIALARHAAESGAEGVAVIAPPYYQLDDAALLAHFVAAARACAPLPFYAYELEKASGYAIPPSVIERLRDAVDNLVGMKVSDAPFAKVQPYMLDGLDVFIGAESLIGEGLAAGAAGAVSGLAAAFPEIVVEAVRSGDSTRAGRAATGDRPLPASRRIEGCPRRPRRDHARGRTGAAARAHGRGAGRTARARPLVLLALRRLAQIVDRLPGAGVHVRAPGVDVGRLRTLLVSWLLGRLLLRRLLFIRGFARVELRAEILGGRRCWSRRGSAAAATQERTEPQSPRKERKQALHRGDATLPPLLATPVAPSPEAAYRRRGRFSP